MWELDYKESWVCKNWSFWTVVLEKILESPFTARRSNQSILKEISPKYWLEGLTLKLKLQYFGHLMRRTDSLEKTLMLGKTEGRRRGMTEDKMAGWHHPTWWTGVWASFGSWWWTGKPGVLQSMGSQRVEHDWTTELKRSSNINSSDLKNNLRGKKKKKKKTLPEFPACLALSTEFRLKTRSPLTCISSLLAYHMEFELINPHNRIYPIGLVFFETLIIPLIKPECESSSDCQG